MAVHLSGCHRWLIDEFKSEKSGLEARPGVVKLVFSAGESEAWESDLPVGISKNPLFDEGVRTLEKSVELNIYIPKVGR